MSFITFAQLPEVPPPHPPLYRWSSLGGAGPWARQGQAIGVKNGTLATLEHVAAELFVARLDDGRKVAFHPGQYNHIAHGYAVTIHKSQGATVPESRRQALVRIQAHAGAPFGVALYEV